MKTIAAILIAGTGSLVTRAVLRMARRRLAPDRLRHARGEPVERPPEPGDVPAPG